MHRGDPTARSAAPTRRNDRSRRSPTVVRQATESLFAADEFPGLIGSWNAINPVTGAAHEVITPRPGWSMTRPNGSGEGLNALRKSLNPATTATQLTDQPEPGCVDIARSSNGPGANASVTGALQYVPFELDAVATSTGPATAGGGAVATNITHADDLTLGNPTTPGTLIKLYRDCAPVVGRRCHLQPEHPGTGRYPGDPPVRATVRLRHADVLEIGRAHV